MPMMLGNQHILVAIFNTIEEIKEKAKKKTVEKLSLLL